MGNKKKKKRVEMTMIHFAKLIFRSLIFISAVFVYVHNYIYGSPTFFGDINENNIYYMFVWIVFMIEMILRFFRQNGKAWVVRNSSAEISNRRQGGKTNIIKRQDRHSLW